MNSSYCLNMSLCNNHENNETNISFYNILLNACAKGTCIMYIQHFRMQESGHVIKVNNINQSCVFDIFSY